MRVTLNPFSSSDVCAHGAFSCLRTLGSLEHTGWRVTMPSPERNRSAGCVLPRSHRGREVEEGPRAELRVQVPGAGFPLGTERRGGL